MRFPTKLEFFAPAKKLEIHILRERVRRPRSVVRVINTTSFPLSREALGSPVLFSYNFHLISDDLLPS